MNLIYVYQKVSLVLRVGFVGQGDIVTHLDLKCPGGYFSRVEECEGCDP